MKWIWVLWAAALIGLSIARVSQGAAAVADECDAPRTSVPVCEHGEETDEAFERDRAAILAMAGEFKVIFNFEETVAVAPGYELRKPYHAEATEFVDVIEDTGERIVLQHILVLPGDDNDEPRVVKHWRQDWTYEDAHVLCFRGDRTWRINRLSPQEVRGTWSQAVYQVDDSPRYESYGRWTHKGGRSSWRSQETWRPLPRREYTKRSDYDVLVAINTHTLTAEGWIHEQANHKLVLREGIPHTTLAHERGVNRYVRISDHDFAAGRRFWRRTHEFWRQVRAAWDEVLATRDTVTLKDRVDGRNLAQRLNQMVHTESREPRDVRGVLARYLEQ